MSALDKLEGYLSDKAMPDNSDFTVSGRHPLNWVSEARQELALLRKQLEKALEPAAIAASEEYAVELAEAYQNMRKYFADGDGAEECADSTETASDEPAPVVNTKGAEEPRPSPVIDATDDTYILEPTPTAQTEPDYGPVAESTHTIHPDGSMTANTES